MEILHTRVKSLYGEAKGILEHLSETGKNSRVPSDVVRAYNQLIDELEQVTESKYQRQKITDNQSSYAIGEISPLIGALVVRLEAEYDLGPASTGATTSPIVVTVNQSQHQVQVTQVDIDVLIHAQRDEEARQMLEELKNELQKVNPDKTVLRTLLGKILSKSWEVFIAILPFLLEKLGQRL